QVVPDRVEVALQIQVDDLMQLFDEADPDAVERIMRRPARAVPVGNRLEVRLEDGLQDQTPRPLHHPITDGRDLQAPDLASLLRNVHMPAWEREGVDCSRITAFTRPRRWRRSVAIVVARSWGGVRFGAGLAT